MTKYREILRLKSLGYSERNIALCYSVSRNTVAKVCARAKELGITWPLAPDQTDKVLSKILFPKEKTTAKRRMTDYEWVRKELFLNEKQNAWITAHVHMLEYFQGVPKIIVPDNTATAVNHKNSNW